MKAKDFLLQVQRLDTMIKNKIAEKEQWWTIATNTTASYNGERVQSSGSQQKMADAAITYVDYEREIDRRIDELIDVKRDIISVIEQLPTHEYDVLHKHYIQGMELVDVADAKQRTYSWVTTVHGRALKHVQDILRGREDAKDA